MTNAKSWQDFRAKWERRLLEGTGADVEEWGKRIAAAGHSDEVGARVWLSERGVTGYAQMLLVWERFGYPHFLLASADELVDRQYADRPGLRPVLDGVLAVTPSLGEVTVQARKSYVCLVTPRRTFAVVKPTTKSRVDLGLRLDGVAPGGRLLPAKGLGSDAINLRVPLGSGDDLDDEVVELLRRAYAGST